MANSANEDKYINPFTDIGFKRIFAHEPDKDVLIDFLNDVLHDEEDFDPIIDIQYRNTEKPRDEERLKKIVYDIFCICQSGRRFIVEMQQRAHPNFDNRSIYYVADAVCDQSRSGADWGYELLPVYGIFITNFTMENLDPEVLASVSLRNDKSGKLYSNKTRYIYIQLPYFNKKEEECVSGFDKWIYVLKNMETIDAIPFQREKKVFEKLKKLRDVFAMSEEERIAYKQQLKDIRDLNWQFTYERNAGREEGLAEGFAEGRAEGRAEANRQTALKLKERGFGSDEIFEITGCRI